MTATIPVWDMADRMRKSLRESEMGAGEMSEYLGVSRQTISRWLGGGLTPRTPALRLWAMATNVPFEWLRDGEATKAPSEEGASRVVRQQGLEPRTR